MPVPAKVWLTFLALTTMMVASCSNEFPSTVEIPEMEEPTETEPPFQGALNLSPGLNYANQPVPSYILIENPAEAAIEDPQATLGRVLFYDQNLSSNRTVACASCHHQKLAFGDNTITSMGVNGQTPRHAMRLFNVRFTSEPRFFWDERAGSLEEQVLTPIFDHVEMGFSGERGAPAMDELLERMNQTDYYGELFTAAYGAATVTEAGIREGLAHFIRSIQSFDSRFDEGSSLISNGSIDFPNFTDEENEGKFLFGTSPQYGTGGERVGGGFGCGNCHHFPEFSVVRETGNNGVTARQGGGLDFTVTRAPSLRNLFRADGAENGPFMHNGAFPSLAAVLEHYDRIPTKNPGLDSRLLPAGEPQRLNMTPREKAAVIAFLKTLTGKAIFTDERWSDPFAR